MSDVHTKTAFPLIWVPHRRAIRETFAALCQATESTAAAFDKFAASWHDPEGRWR